MTASEAISRAADLPAIHAALGLLLERRAVAELRAPRTCRGTVSGYFDNLDKLAKAAARLSGTVPGVYVTLNPVNRDLLARASNRVIEYAKHTTGDADVVRRGWVLLDLDPVRPSGIAATDAEHTAALERTRECAGWLQEMGVSSDSLLVVDTGNGGAILLRVDLENDAASKQLVDGMLAAVAFRFSDERVAVDLSVSNAARIWRVPGTLNAKGDDTVERPHRLARVREAPGHAVPVPRGLLERLAAMAPVEERTERRAYRGGGRPFDLEAFITRHGLSVLREGPWNGGRRWLLEACPFNADHRDGPALLRFASGAIAFRCLHNSCHGKDWHALRDLLEPEREWRERARTKKARTSAAATATDENGEEHLTDLGNAKRLVTAHGADLRYCAKLGGWYVWDGRRWAFDETGEVVRCAKQTVLGMLVVAADIAHDEIRKQMVQWALRSQGADRLTAMVKLATTEAGVPLTAEQLDADPWTLNVLNGTIELRTGVLRPHRRDDLLTKLAPVVYDPTAWLELWERFLRETTGGDDDLADFLRRAVGYTLTGDTSEEKLLLLHGPEAAGKSTFVEAIKAALGDYAVTADFGAFLARRDGGGPRNDLARLAGARLVASIEVDEGKKLAQGLVKQLTGGDTVSARFMYREFFEFTPTFKLWLAANHAPKVADDDGAMWRRILRVPFQHTVAKERRDPKVKATLRDPAAAGPAILAWAVQGCLAWQRQGLGVPPAVEAATEAYREEMDPLRDFIHECCVVAPDAWAPSKALWERYRDWAKEGGLRWPLTRGDFNDRLTAHGFVADKGAKGTRVRRGIGLADAEVAEVALPNTDSGNFSQPTRVSGVYGKHLDLPPPPPPIPVEGQPAAAPASAPDPVAAAIEPFTVDGQVPTLVSAGPDPGWSPPGATIAGPGWNGTALKPYAAEAPAVSCPTCGGGEWHRAGSGWSCSRCHPPVRQLRP